MSEEKPKVMIRMIYLVLGAIALVIAFFDVFVNNYFDTALSVSWGALFIFLGMKKWLDSSLRKKSVNIIHSIILIVIIVASLSKLIYRLKTLPF